MPEEGESSEYYSISTSERLTRALSRISENWVLSTREEVEEHWNAPAKGFSIDVFHQLSILSQHISLERAEAELEHEINSRMTTKKRGVSKQRILKPRDLEMVLARVEKEKG